MQTSLSCLFAVVSHVRVLPLIGVVLSTFKLLDPRAGSQRAPRAEARVHIRGQFQWDTFWAKWIETGFSSVTSFFSISLTFRHRASCILGQAFHYSPENGFYIFNQQIYFII